MAFDTNGLSDEEIAKQQADQAAARTAFQQSISTPEGMKAYDDSMARRWSDIQNKTNGYQEYGGGGVLGALGKIMEPIMNATLKYGPYIYAAAAGGQALGLFGGAGAEAAGAAGVGSAGADVGLGSMAIDHAGLEGLGFLDSMGTATGGLGGMEAAGAGASAGGLGNMIGIEGGAPAVVNVGAPAAATGGSLGAGATLGAGIGAAGLGNMIGTADNPAVVQVPAPTNPTTPNGPLSPLGAAAGGVGAGALLGALAHGTDPVTGAPGPTNQQTAPGDAEGTTPPVVTPTGSGGLPSGLTGLIPGLGNLFGGLLGGNVDRIKADQDADWWKSQLDTLQGMYKPGTPEADLMEQKMRAKDAAAGRNSQYGIRATDLAAQLADKRAGIMTSAGYQNMSNAYRNRSSQDLNGLFSAMGQNGGLGGIGSLLGQGISSLFGGGSATPTVNVTPPVR